MFLNPVQRFTVMNPMLMRLSQRGYFASTRINLNSNNFLVIDDNGGVKSPKLKFRNHDRDVTLDPHIKLCEVEARMKRNNLIAANSKAEFFSPDGARYASSCTVG